MNFTRSHDSQLRKWPSVCKPPSLKCNVLWGNIRNLVRCVVFGDQHRYRWCLVIMTRGQVIFINLLVDLWNGSQASWKSLYNWFWKWTSTILSLVGAADLSKCEKNFQRSFKNTLVYPQVIIHCVYYHASRITHVLLCVTHLLCKKMIINSKSLL